MGRTLIFHGFKPYLDASFKEFLLTTMFFLLNSLWSYVLRLLAFVLGLFYSSSSGEISTEVCEKSVEKTCESSSKYEFSSGKCAFAVIEEPETTSFTVQEMFMIPHEDSSPIRQDFMEGNSFPKNGFLRVSVNLEDISPNNDLFVDSTSSGYDSSSSEYSCASEFNEEEEAVKQGETESYDSSFLIKEHDTLGEVEQEVYVSGEIVNEEDKIVGEDEVLSSTNSSNDFWASIHKYGDFYGNDHEFDSDSDEILCDKSPCEAIEPETPMGIGDKRVDYDQYSQCSLDDISLDQSISHLGDVNVENEADTQYIELEPRCFSSVVGSHVEEHFPRDQFTESDDEIAQESSTFEDSKGINASKKYVGEGDITGVSDVLLEQKELIRQMKREMRNLKISGLPTILEGSEPPRVEDDLRPLKISERIGHKDRMDEIQTLYRMYLAKMRKLDILRQQTMYGIGLLHLKNQDQLASNRKIHVPVINSILAQNFWSHKFRKHETDPLQKLLKDFQKDLELVYVGELCVSWETLKWQHHKAKQLHAHDPEGFRHHNQVAGEFQKFQVLLRRFTEDEPFHHGPRVQHYVKTKSSLPNLLQVPLIKDDIKGKCRGKDEGGISIGMLKEVIEASMKAFWEFLRADKDEVHGITLMGLHGPQTELEDPLDMDLLVEIRSILQKKEKRLKDIAKSGNCIVKKFQKHKDNQLSHELFLAQVELRVVSRVLGMSKLTTEQILWCHNKVGKINIVGRKIYLESSFLLFPC